MKRSLIFICYNLFALLLASGLAAQTVKVFILAGQSNMQGHGEVLPGTTPGTLTQFMDDGGDEEFEYIRDTDGNWSTRDDVWVRYDHENGELLADELRTGLGGSENQIGPELGFGHLLGEYTDDQVLIIKTCWGGKNLAVDFRPPSSGGEVGPYYNQMISDVNAAIENIATEFPEYAGQEIEIAGLAWFQGWNDGEEESFLNEYEDNLINLIADVRTDLNTPELPVVIGLVGIGGFEIDQGDAWVRSLQTLLVPAQINAAEFAGHTNVTFTETRGFWRAGEESPEPDFVHHWRNNAESYLRIGIALGERMIDLIGNTTTAGVVPAMGYGFNYFFKEAVPDNSFGAGYSFYSAVWPLMEHYPGYENYQAGLGTWLTPRHVGDIPDDYYNTIEGGLGWWGDTRFGTTTPKFIMGGVAHSFDAAANGPGAGSGDRLEDGHRNWNSPGGKYGVAQLSPNLLWPPDGLNMEQGSNGQFLGYGYHPLPFTDPMEETNGVDFTTGNQCWTLFMNTTNFKGPAAFFIPTFWAATILNDPDYEGLFLDSKPSDPNMSFAQEYSASPALIGTDSSGDVYARILPPVYPKTTATTSELMRDISVYSADAKWNEVENWFNGGPVPPTELQAAGTLKVDYAFDPVPVDAAIYAAEGPVIDAPINQEQYAQVKMSPDQKVGIFEWDTIVIGEVSTGFIMPEFYALTQNNEWEAIPVSDVPVSSGLIDNEPAITPRNEDLPYISPLEADCHVFGTENPWNTPGPVSGPFTVSVGDGTELTYYWYRFIDQPSIINANLPAEMRENIQERIEKIHTNWHSTDAYIANPTGGELATIDPGLIITPPAGLEIGYVPIVTRQEKDLSPSSANDLFNAASLLQLGPNPNNGVFTIQGDFENCSIQVVSQKGSVLQDFNSSGNSVSIDISALPSGLYYIRVIDAVNNKFYLKKVLKQ